MFNARNLTIALAVPALLGLAFVTAETGDYKKSSGNSSCQSAKQANASGSCTGAKVKQASGSTCSSTKASVKQASANGSCSGAAKASASCTSAKATVKQASAGSGCCASGAKMSMASACTPGEKCGVSLVKAEDGLRIYALGNEASTKEWMEKVAMDLRENKNLNVEIFEAKGGSYMLVKSTSNGAASYSQMVQAAAGETPCMAVCAANGCPPKA